MTTETVVTLELKIEYHLSRPEVRSPSLKFQFVSRNHEILGVAECKNELPSSPTLLPLGEGSQDPVPLPLGEGKGEGKRLA
ncbi:MAG: hypothetical protein KME30_19385 [Iphinoe sp. HA4291-MV1]|nr:hypothetical protein [Iphinoe sp. HA4291-MV1]